jgi:hypothetical protein
MALSKDPGSTANSAYNIGNLSGLKIYTEFVGSTDTQDIYKFSLTETSDLDLGINNYFGNLNVSLYIDRNKNALIDDGELLYFREGDSWIYGNEQGENLNINSALGAGDYFISVSPLEYYYYEEG